MMVETRIPEVIETKILHLQKKKKMTQGWVVYGGMRHAEPQRETFPRSYMMTTYLSDNVNNVSGRNQRVH